MAKDKSKKDKGEKATKSGGFAKPSEAPSGGDGFNLQHEDNIGKLMIFTPLREKEVDDKFSKTAGATKTIIVANVVVVDTKKPEKSEEHEDVYVYGGYVIGSLRPSIGKAMVLGRLRRDKKNKVLGSTNEPWYLEDADADDEKAANDYIASLSPFGKGGDDEPKKPKKDAGKKKPKK